HFTTRQNLQYNWIDLKRMPDLLDELASVEMHAIQTSGNCVRNITSDPYAGVAVDEFEDPRPYAELLRQWSTFHPEFAALPRKFKIAITGAERDRAAIAVHDIGIRLVRREGDGAVGLSFLVGGGQGRTPTLGAVIRPWIEKEHLLSYTEAILRVYNRFGRRDNLFKARIKILVKSLGADEFARQVDAEWERIKDSELKLESSEIESMKAFFAPPSYDSSAGGSLDAQRLSKNRPYARWVERNVERHRVPGYAIASISLKTRDLPTGDLTADQMDAVAALADEFSFGELVVNHRQNLVFPNVRIDALEALWKRLETLGLGLSNVGTITDIVCCPGLDYCSLANARSITVASALQERFADAGRADEVGDVTLNISGCINACGHHHVGNIGILGIDKQGVEHYQLMVGGSHEDDASFGKILGPAFTQEEIPNAVDRLVSAYVALRTSPEERFLDTYRRLGDAPFKERVYARD
ncbi:MAG: nitrite/sulfite reductase, partial [Myxococcales bacterium]|nr:nitrite/sulfite reductase [Myxococcales bacterium]